MPIADSRVKTAFCFLTALILSPLSTENRLLILFGEPPTCSVRLIHSNFSTLITLRGDGNKQLSPLWNKKTGLRARRSRVTCDPVVVVDIFLLENFEVSFAREHIHSVPSRIEEKIVRLASNFSGCDLLTRIGIKDQ